MELAPRTASISTLAIGVTLLFCSCAGPYSPVGSIDSLDPAQKRRTAGEIVARGIEAVDSLIRPQIRFSPNRLVVHDRSILNIEVVDPLGIPDSAKVSVIFNGLEVTNEFSKVGTRKLSDDRKSLSFRIPSLRVSSRDEVRLEVFYSRSGSGATSAYRRLEPPTCGAFSPQKIRRTGSFRVDQRTLASVEREAKGAGFNPGLLAGLIAQESGFENFTVSWAKAIGVSQITSASEMSVIQQFPTWPRYPRLDDRSVPEIKALMFLGKLNGSNEWRLDEEKNIQGAVAYLLWIRKYWHAPDNIQLLHDNFSDLNAGLEQVILASYHAGPARVKKSLQDWGQSWLMKEGLTESKHYINSVTSYCYHFTNDEEYSRAE